MDLLKNERIKIFIPDEEFVWLSASIENQNEDESVFVEVLDDEYLSLKRPVKKNVKLNELPDLYNSFPLQNEDMDTKGVDDMCSLNYLHEASILDNLLRRFKSQIPYTYTGDICIAVNPYQWLPIYTDSLRDEHIKKFRHELDPHVYATSSCAYRGIRDYSKNQSILVSGESGAGKTETVKILMGHIAHISGKKYDSTIEKVLKANPLLESFGNAKTLRNDNSSRFGKFTQLQFDEFTKLVGSKCVTYLLEKSRVISQHENERNYHIFHELFAAPKHIKKSIYLADLDVKSFNYMSKSDDKTKSIEGISDSERFLTTIETLELLGVSKSDVQKILEILSGLLYLGQITFIGANGDNDKSIIDPRSSSFLETAAKLLGINPGEMSQKITIRNIEVVGEEMVVPLTVDQAKDGRDALAKEIYARLFLWLVGVINMSTASFGKIYSSVSLLDIFGFESFNTNRFEQLCINYANEKLQQKFTLDVFQNVQHEYQEEGLKWEKITYKDNSHVIELIEGKPGTAAGLMAILNEECLIPRGSDSNLLAKLKKTCNTHQSFSFSTVGLQSKDEFCINHYAGKISYNINGFVDRNKDTIANEARLMMMESENKIIAEVFTHVTYSIQSIESANNQNKSDDVNVKGKKISIGVDKGFMRSETIVTKFKGQLNSLMETINQTDVQYVRCVKPNSAKSNSIFDRKMVVEQLRCAGMIEAIRITRAAYPYRVLQPLFIKRFSGLKTKKWNRVNSGTSPAAHCLALLTGLIKPSDSEDRSYEIGKTKVYFSSVVLQLLESMRSRLLYMRIEMIQRVYRGVKVYKWYRSLKRSAILIESVGRMWILKNTYRKKKKSIISIQCAHRIFIAKKKLQYKKWLKKVIVVQSVIRMWKWKSRYISVRKAAIKLGALIRKFLKNKKLEKAKLQTDEQNRLASKLEALRNKLKSESDLKGSRSFSSEFIPLGRDISEIGGGGGGLEVNDEDLSVLVTLQEQLRALRAENERLEQENIHLKSYGRKEQFSLDSKIAVVAVGKATIQNLERERDSLKIDYDKIEKQIKQFKLEKQHVVESLLSISSELDVTSRELRKYKRMFDTERAIRLSQILREREIMKHVRNLLRHRGVEYSQITENKKRMCELIHLYSKDEDIIAEQLNGRLPTDPTKLMKIDEQPTRRTKSSRMSQGKSRKAQSKKFQTLDEIDSMSMISSVSTHLKREDDNYIQNRRSLSPKKKKISNETDHKEEKSPKSKIQINEIDHKEFLKIVKQKEEEEEEEEEQNNTQPQEGETNWWTGFF